MIDISRGIYWDLFCDVFNGCVRIGEPCNNCWAINNVWRFAHNPNEKLREKYGGLVEKLQRGWKVHENKFVRPLFDYEWTGKTTVDFEPLERLTKVRRPKVVAFSWRGDWMHKSDKDDIDWTLDLMGYRRQHIFLTLTKRPEKLDDMIYGTDAEHSIRELGGGDYHSNIWIGVSAWDQESWENASRYLAPLKKRGWHTWVSLEPLLAPIDITTVDFKPEWIVCGAETGKAARKISDRYIEDVYTAGVHFNIPVFVKHYSSGSAVDSSKRKFPREIGGAE